MCGTESVGQVVGGSVGQLVGPLVVGRVRSFAVPSWYLSYCQALEAVLGVVQQRTRNSYFLLCYYSPFWTG